ncbi:hypothetical protein PVAND_014590 [Polypedilum vanderplanki]|uniref:Peptidase S1 domain-containing protein n=1 Tax=Polypedilum vanderplanki TaxID=319348 RepID=A0A9J6B9U3_POLVA|nr:hypothetical protein PVAND_014590 [Polypedilum vanderplanki]
MRERVGHDLFSSFNISQIKTFDFSRNRCIGGWRLTNTTEIKAKIEEIREKCPFDDENLTTNAIISSTTSSNIKTTTKNSNCIENSVEEMFCTLKNEVYEIHYNLAAKDDKINEIKSDLNYAKETFENQLIKTTEDFESVNRAHESRIKWLEDEILRLSTNPCASSGEACTTFDGSRGVCKHVQSCTEIEELTKLQPNAKFTRCDRFKRLVCCPIKNFSAENENKIFQSSSVRISERKCREYGKSVIQVVKYSSLMLGEPDKETMINKCKHKGTSLIIGGIEAAESEFPHQALLGYDRGQWVCGGSLISPKFVLTAAHCIHSNYYGDVKLVKVGLNDRSQIEGVLTFGVAKTFKYPEFNEILLNHDIALIKLNSTVRFNEFILPICLPTRDYDENKAIVSGFGSIGNYNGVSEKLMKVTLEKFSYEDCQNSFERLIDKNTMLCYGHHTEEKDSCSGDSGGPLQIYNKEVNCTYIQLGIVSFASTDSCGWVDLPAVYVKVYNYLDWIENIVWNVED